MRPASTTVALATLLACGDALVDAPPPAQGPRADAPVPRPSFGGVTGSTQPGPGGGGGAGELTLASLGDDGAATRDASAGAGAVSSGGRIVVMVSAADELAGERDGILTVFARDRTLERTELVSGAAADGDAFEASVSGDGRHVAFSSVATNLGPEPASGFADVFVHDRLTGALTRVLGAALPDGASFDPSLSADGRTVAFTSLATNLVPDDANGGADVFVTELPAGRLTRASVGGPGLELGGDSAFARLSPDGRYVVFASLAPELSPDAAGPRAQVLLHDRALVVTEVVSRAGGLAGDGPSGGPGMQAVSAGGARVAFASRAASLVAGAPVGRSQVLVRERGAREELVLASVGESGEPGDADSGACSISADGRFVVFVSVASNLVAGTPESSGVYVRDLDAERTARVDDGVSAVVDLGQAPAVSPDGLFVTWTARPVAAAAAGAPAGVAQVLVAENPLAR